MYVNIQVPKVIMCYILYVIIAVILNSSASVVLARAGGDNYRKRDYQLVGIKGQFLNRFVTFM